MVFLSMVNFIKRSGFDPSIKKQRILKLTAKYYGRKRNCYSVAIKFLQKALRYTTASRKIKPQYVAELRKTRIDAAAAEHGTSGLSLAHNLIKCRVSLDNVILQDLAIWEPQTFKCLTDLAKYKEKLEANPQKAERLKFPEGVITKGML
ncbi:hypothetical protein JTE90_005633 [Oedothorax gibbosus]|uniref:39S ribosomal protein L20, mitochondrial n=1 Tax=Oedothorax gibbosus TaxID=931172 RepID=A0AAV6UK27_9ARAC|nr:hypothetical protein JTE90_005633 [Oedothorax gibbosus]